MGYRETTLIWILLLGLIVSLTALGPASASVESDRATSLETDLEYVREALGIPGMAAAVVEDGRLIWSAGFGFADIENQIAADPHTPFGLASVTKPIAATLVMQLVEEGVIDLDALMSSYGVDLPDGDGVTVRHLLNHTSEGIPGTVHNYNGNRYGYLGGVIQGATGRSFSDLLGERILVPLEMTDTALNPMSSWEGSSTVGFEEFGRTLGWGDSFDHYPDVYERLAQPYQFDDDYSIIPGMYHLTHSPAAGGISSVTDLATFDIALEDGSLLGDTALREMLSPFVQTVSGRSDLAYGLGWYVQDFDGMRLTWHTGRWPPSTSGLYLKVRELDLTFVALANTDNMTVPFPGIGQGDLSKSLLALTFLHHFGYPEVHGSMLPIIDWSAGEEELVTHLAAVDDNDARLFLERELWSHRQALASSGQFARAQILETVARRAFPGSSMRLDDNVVATVGKMPNVPSITRAASLALVTRVILGWFALILACLAWMAVRVLPPRDGWWVAAMWLLATLLLGPITILIHHQVKKDGTVTPLGQVLGASLFCVVGYSIAWVISVWLLKRSGDEPNPLSTLAALVVVPILTGLLVVKAPLLQRLGVQYGRAIRRGIFAEMITWSIGLAAFFSVTIYVDNRWLSTIPFPTSPYYGAMASLAALVALLVLVVVHWMLLNRGFTIWATASSGHQGADATVSLPTLRNSWLLLLGTLAVAFAAIALAAGAFDGG